MLLNVDDHLVHAMGLFIGIELVANRTDKTPATEETIAAVEAMREAGVLLSPIGQHRNILKIRPPLTLQKEHADIVLEKLPGDENLFADFECLDLYVVLLHYIDRLDSRRPILTQDQAASLGASARALLRALFGSSWAGS